LYNSTKEPILFQVGRQLSASEIAFAEEKADNLIATWNRDGFSWEMDGGYSFFGMRMGIGYWRSQRDIKQRKEARAVRTLKNYRKKILPCKVLQVDEVWSFTYCKQANVPQALKGADGLGDAWTWIALDSDTKLIPCFHVGKRDATDAYKFITDLAGRLANRVHLTSDGHKAYLQAVEDAFGSEIDYAQLIKLYGKDHRPVMEARYSPPPCIGARKLRISGNPERQLVSTSHIERQNLTVRMGNRRFTRLTNAFSKKLENHMHHAAIHFMHYNFCRVHQALRVTPAMESGISDHVWSLEEIINLIG
jgi:IS1 family transposase